MVYRISRESKIIKGTFTLPASKSESNRALIIRQFCQPPFTIHNLSESQDTQVLLHILTTDGAALPGGERIYDVGAAGTTMRFLTAYFSVVQGIRELHGSERMHKRPLAVLIRALQELGAKIECLEKEGYPPIRITGADLRGGAVTVNGSISSQYISALLMIAPVLPVGLVIHFEGEVASRPYINMTLKLMERFGVFGNWHENVLSVSPQKYYPFNEEGTISEYEIEADWSAASYWYAIASFAEEADITLLGLKEGRLQGDSILPHLFQFFGVSTQFLPEGGIRLNRIPVNADRFGFDFIDCPDIAQTMAVVATAKGIPALCRGLRTLKIKETDRAAALQAELRKFGIDFQIKSDDAALFDDHKGISEAISEPIDTYDDHRMAMAFATLAMKLGSVSIRNPEVVSKSYPGFWNDMRTMGFGIEEIK
ncbi:MAG: 3-phosphoshikimate 1-carboxyvinyltransferase [Bacteroidia bacterium]|nr:3-phosphoshikimate 1-carboxyvinyltransferase [Bacteroidia bacterium]